MESEHSERFLARPAQRVPMTHPAWEDLDTLAEAADDDPTPSSMRVEARRRRQRVNHRQRWENRGVDHYRLHADGQQPDPEAPSMDVLK